MYEEQLKNGYPGLVREAQELCEKMGIPDITKERIKDPSKAQLKSRIKEAVEKNNGKELKGDMERYEKLEVMKKEDYEQKDYLSNLSLEQARTLFRVRTRTIPCKFNQSSDRGNRESLWQCRACGYVETQTHIMHCPAYKDLREGKSLDSDEDIAEYFGKVLKLREKLKL